MELRPASTVMLCRDTEGRIETFMLRRSASSRFVPNAYVFPGGTVEASDSTSSADTPAELKRLFRMHAAPAENMQMSLVSAARRELFEETGVRLASADAIELFSHWITPLSVTPRYDVYFFVARMPPGQRAVADATETHDGVWVAPADALARADAGTMHVIYPTRMHLERLRRFGSVDELLDFARTKPVTTVMPNGEESTGFTLPAGIEDSW